VLKAVAQESAEAARLEERTRIAQELHDTLLQTFQSASLHLGATMYRLAEDSPIKPHLDRILEIMRQGIAEGRYAIQGLRSARAQVPDLIPALIQAWKDFGESNQVEFSVEATGTQMHFTETIQHEIYRISREALSNAFHHSGAKRVELRAEFSGTGLCIRIRDDGCGINPQLLDHGREGHWGLLAMRERAASLGAQLKIVSRVAQGTEVQIFIPADMALGHEGSIAARVHGKSGGKQKGSLSPILAEGYWGEPKYRAARGAAH
jgi:signal transduction histidine kinase